MRSHKFTETQELREHQKHALIEYLLAPPELRTWLVVDAECLFDSS